MKAVSNIKETAVWSARSSTTKFVEAASSRTVLIGPTISVFRVKAGIKWKRESVRRRIRYFVLIDFDDKLSICLLFIISAATLYLIILLNHRHNIAV